VLDLNQLANHFAKQGRFVVITYTNDQVTAIESFPDVNMDAVADEINLRAPVPGVRHRVVAPHTPPANTGPYLLDSNED
jgi:hypothetical protein